MKIAFIGPGIMSIPPISWGAVEIIIWEYSERLKKLGHEVEIFNTRDLATVKKTIEASNFDFVHLHFDDFLEFFENITHPNFAVTSHYGYLTREEKYEWYYWKIFHSFVNTRHKIFALSDGIKNQYLKYNKNLNVTVQRNGSNIESFKFEKQPKFSDRTIYLGKVEPRKCQHIYAPVDGLNIDFVGNGNNLNFLSKNNRHLGVWNKQEVYEKMTEYANLCLISEGEAHALVCVEALASGLGLVINEEVAANLDTSRDFITVIPNSKIKDLNYVSSKLKENREISVNKRQDIRKYAEENFDWNIIVNEYLKKIGI